MELEDYLADIDDTGIEADHGRPAPIPAGDYILELVDREFKPTKDGTGAMMSCQFKVSEGGFEGRRVFANFNIKNKSEQAQRIGLGQVKGFCAAAGVSWEDARADSSILIGRPCLATVGLSKTTDQYPDPRNEIKAFKMATGEVPAGKPAPAPRPMASAPASAGGKALPWKKQGGSGDARPPF